jgi:alpha-1,2-mannosyltransferase
MTNNLWTRRWNFRLGAYLLGVVCCNALFFSWCGPYLRSGNQDFTIYYMAGKLVRQGQSALLYDPVVQLRTQLTFVHVPNARRAIPYNHPPFEALLFVPLALLNYWPAYLLWSALNFAMLGTAAALLRRFPKIRELPLSFLVLGCLALYPVIVGLIQGQYIFLLLLLMVLAFRSLDRGKETAAGIWLAAGLFRPHIALPMALLLAVRHRRLLWGFVPTALFLEGVCTLMMGWRWPWVYLDFVLQVEQGKSGRFGPHQIPNLRGLIAEMPGVQGSSVVTTGLILVVSLAVFGLAVLRIKKGRDSLSFCFCLATVTSILVSFHALYYDFTFLLPLILFLLAAFVTSESARYSASLVGVIVAVFFSPLYMYIQLTLNRFFLMGLIVIVLYVRLLRSPMPAEPA